MAEEDVVAVLVDNESGMCKAGFPGDEAPCVDNDSGKAGFASDDAPCAVLSSVSTLKSPVMSKGRQWEDSAFEELFIDPTIYEVFFIPMGRRPERNTSINFVFFRALSEFPSPSREALRTSLCCVHGQLTERVIKQTPRAHAPS